MMTDRHASLNLNVRGLHQSATLVIQQQVRDLRAQGRPVYNLGLGQSPFPVPPHVVAALHEHAHEKDYLPVQGLPQLRTAIADYMKRTQGLNTSADRVLVGPGSKELLFLLQLCFYGDLIVASPAWVSYTPQSHIVGRQVRRVPTFADDGWKIDPERLADLFEADHDQYRPRLLVLNYPANPTGTTYTADELKAIAKVAKQYDVLILSDEIYSGLHHEGNHVSISRYYPEGTIVLNGISKWAGAGGWRLGAFIFPENLQWLQRAMAAVASETYTSVCTPIQYAAVKAFEPSAEMEDYLHHARRVLASLTSECCDRLEGAGAHVVRPGGAFYLFPDFSPLRRRLGGRKIRTSTDLCRRLLDRQGVAMLPGAAFERPVEELTARMSLVDFDGEQALAMSRDVPKGERLDAAFLAKAAPNVLEAMDRLRVWLEKKA